MRHSASFCAVLVNFEGETAKVNVPDPLEDEDETLAKWSRRVLGPDVSNVVIYVPESLSGARKLAKLQKTVDATHLRQVVRAQAKVKNAQAVVKAEKAVEKTERIFSTFSKDTIEDHLADLGDTLETSVREFLRRQIDDSPDDIDADALLKELIQRFSDSTMRRVPIER